MSKIIKIAVERTEDPMHKVMDCLFGKCEILISDEILNVMKKLHSYTKTVNGKEEKYVFQRRTRGTDALFSFVVTTGEKGNKVFGLECVAELGLMKKSHEEPSANAGKKVYITLEGEENS